MFVEERLPDLIAFGAVGGPRFLTSVGTSTSGYEQRANYWTLERGQWDLSYNYRTAEQTAALIAFFTAVACGRAHGFRYYDHATQEQQGLNEFLGAGDGVLTTFQLRKLYTVDSESYARLITKPVADTVQMTLNGTATTAFTVDTTTSLVTCTVPPGLGVIIRASFLFDVPVRFDTDWLSLRGVEPGLYSWESLTLVEIRDV
jgi:uncharacterized protein (TIGR02217 family)